MNEEFNPYETPAAFFTDYTELSAEKLPVKDRVLDLLNDNPKLLKISAVLFAINVALIMKG